MTKNILIKNSLAFTLWNLEEARLSGMSKSDAEAALTWIAARHGEGSYRNMLFAPTKSDYKLKHPVMTNEGTSSGANIAHILGEEAVRALSIWDYHSGWEADATYKSIITHFGSREIDPSYAAKPGRFCCGICSIARLRAVAAGLPKGYRTVLDDGLEMLRNAEVTSTGRWKGFPFYYTLLGLRDLNEVEPKKVRKILDIVFPAIERLAGRVTDKDAASRFRRHAIEWAL